VVDVVDDTFVPAPPANVAARIADPEVWRVWWPELVLIVHEDRGAEGIRWRVRGSLDGTAEVWIEEYEKKGCIVHFFLQADPPRPYLWRPKARARRHTRRYRISWKRNIHALADELAARPPGSGAPSSEGDGSRGRP
jgi:hypothetical protein